MTQIKTEIVQEGREGAMSHMPQLSLSLTLVNLNSSLLIEKMLKHSLIP